MRAKRGKQYKKLLKQFELHFKFREPYQCLGMFLCMYLVSKSASNG